MAIRPIDTSLMSNSAVEATREAGRMNKNSELFQSHLNQRVQHIATENQSKVQNTKTIEQAGVHADGEGNGGYQQPPGKRKRRKVRDLLKDGDSAGYSDNRLDIRV